MFRTLCSNASTANTSAGASRLIWRSSPPPSCLRFEAWARRAALSSSGCYELLEAVKTRRYTLARLRRILCYALIGTTAQLQELAFKKEDALCIRVLGVRREKLHLLSELSKRASLPVVISASDIGALSENTKTVLYHTGKAQLLHALAFPKNRECTEDFSHALVTI